MERRSLPIRFGPNPPFVTLHNPLANSQAETAARELLSMKAFEWCKNHFQMLGIDANTVILHRKVPLAGIPLHRNVDARRRTLPNKFKGVSDEVLKQQD